ncbi:uncharacterized protein LOC115320219 isoform X2 [Ixodes scapularis]|uniref:uncharacterized protein LOC115320219 isoform X2 n=1 Tax=Ixodes scapularis TaxID=6945 RepID=UPI001A9F0327|nr:uncharacterized protein LOC115320219 isoform X2 [Ixodes scapularis]
MNILVVLLGFFSFGACRESVYEANLYLDTVLGVVLPLEVGKANLSLAPLPGFTVKHRTGDFRVQFESGILQGLASFIERRGDCEATRWEAGALTMRCGLDLDGLRLAFQGNARGRDLTAEREVALGLVLRNSSASLTHTEKKGGHVHAECDLGDLNLVLVYSTDLHLKDVSKPVYDQQLVSTARSILKHFLVSHFIPNVLTVAFSKIYLPIPQ